jgi:DNA-binding MarR family transcriptional regulator
MGVRRDPLIVQVGMALREYHRAMEKFDQRVADRLGLNRTDLRCLDLILTRGATSPSRLAAAAALTTGGVTTAIDRLERAGYVARSRGGADRRRVVIEPTEHARVAVGEIYRPFVEESDLSMNDLDEPTLSSLISFLMSVTDIQYHHADLLEHAPGAPAANRGRSGLVER